MFDLGKHQCKAQKKAKSKSQKKRDTVKMVKKMIKKEEAKRQAKEQKQDSNSQEFVPAAFKRNDKQDASKKATPTTNSITKKTKLDDGCTGDFAFDHLKQQENLSKNTLAELEEKQRKLQRESDDIIQQQPLLKKERIDIEKVVNQELKKREVITADYQKLLKSFQEEERRQQLEREKKELAARQEE